MGHRVDDRLAHGFEGIVPALHAPAVVGDPCLDLDVAPDEVEGLFDDAGLHGLAGFRERDRHIGIGAGLGCRE
jgi:hypothetical protein